MTVRNGSGSMFAAGYTARAVAHKTSDLVNLKRKKVCPSKVYLNPKTHTNFTAPKFFIFPGGSGFSGVTDSLCYYVMLLRSKQFFFTHGASKHFDVFQNHVLILKVHFNFGEFYAASWAH